MTIAEKLTKIAENEQKVYDAGYAKGYEEGYAKGVEDSTPLYFYFDDFGTKVTLEVRKDMTWGEWCDSTYNTMGWYISDWDTVYTGAVGLVEVSTQEYPGRDTKINEGSTYTYGF